MVGPKKLKKGGEKCLFGIHENIQAYLKIKIKKKDFDFLSKAMQNYAIRFLCHKSLSFQYEE